MSEDQQHPKKSRLPPPPLVDQSAVRTYYHDKLFKGQFGLPASENVDEMWAEVYQTWATGNPSLSSFKVPVKFHDRILTFFDGGTIQSSPNFIMPEVGTLVIRTKDGNLRRVCWYGGQKSPLMFSLHGVRCMGADRRAEYIDESVALEEVIRDAYEASRAVGMP